MQIKQAERGVNRELKAVGVSSIASALEAASRAHLALNCHADGARQASLGQVAPPNPPDQDSSGPRRRLVTDERQSERLTPWRPLPPACREIVTTMPDQRSGGYRRITYAFRIAEDVKVTPIDVRTYVATDVPVSVVHLAPIFRRRTANRAVR